MDLSLLGADLRRSCAKLCGDIGWDMLLGVCRLLLLSKLGGGMLVSLACDGLIIVALDHNRYHVFVLSLLQRWCGECSSGS
jgi:hypothetical protein